jgi:hypothetical protein
MNTANYLAKFTKPAKIYSQKQLLATEIYEWSSKELNFPMILGMINAKGEQFVRECWATAKDSKADDPVKLFMFKYGEVKVEVK